FSSRRRHTRFSRDWSSDVCSSDLCYGIQRLTLLRGRRGAGLLVLSGAGVGGGSLVYANTLYEPLPDFYDDPQWRDITDWRAELRSEERRVGKECGKRGAGWC